MSTWHMWSLVWRVIVFGMLAANLAMAWRAIRAVKSLQAIRATV